MKRIGTWEIVGSLGEGGQGIVYKVRPQSRSQLIDDSFKELQEFIIECGGPAGAMLTKPKSQKIAAALQRLTEPDPPAELGALKQFKIPPSSRDEANALQRLEREVEALRAIRHPGVLRLIDADLDQKWIVTEYHPHTLSDLNKAFAGKPLAALEAFRTLVAGVAALHQHDRDLVHRDIKPQNIFVAADGRLVLGDFGIVFFRNETGDRLTETFERVGSRDWMAPWANMGMRLEEVHQSFDVFPLGKVLWSMISGDPSLPYWYHRREAYNLERRFPHISDMRVVNELILDACIVEEESQCLPSATHLLERVEEVIRVVSRGGQVLQIGTPRPCRVCGRGQYRPLLGQEEDLALGFTGGDEYRRHGGPVLFNADPRFAKVATVRAFTCDACGHIELFQFPDGGPRNAWRSKA